MIVLDLPYVLQKDHICHYADDIFYIGDRRSFPFERKDVACQTFEEVASALKCMVTQGGGPLQVALTCLEFAASLIDEGKLPLGKDTFSDCLRPVLGSRPTNTTMKRETEKLISKINMLYDQGELSKGNASIQVRRLVGQREEELDQLYDRMAEYGASLLEDGDVVLTTCFAEHTFLLSLFHATKQGKHIRVLVNETRPYLQGARLTAPSLQEMGIDCRIITDGMGAHFMREHEITKYMTAADLVTMDGTVVNKTGTLANAIAACLYGIPYYAFAMSPDSSRHDAGDIVMEMRNPREVTVVMGKPTTAEGIEGLYPAFDVIDPDLVTAVVTGKGVLTPGQIQGAFV
ncbi:MAG: translation initiation factor 2 [Spirochaetia bacterium]|nr:translation initiation factor 2 [Spirochaetia bacterium]